MFRLLIGLFVILDGAWWLYAHRKLRPLARRRLWRGLLAGFMGYEMALMLVWVALPRYLRASAGWIPTPLIAGVYLWHLLVLPLAMLMAGALGLGGLAQRLLRRRRTSAPASAASERPEDVSSPPASPLAIGPTRRQLLGAAAVAVPPLLLCGVMTRGLEQIGQFRIRRLTVRPKGLPAALDGVTIAHVSDVHVGRFTNTPVLESIVEAVNGLRADLVLVTGDLIDFSLSDLPEALAMVRDFHPAIGPAGVAMCLGNHDIFDNGTEFVRRASAKVPLLINDTHTIGVRGAEVDLIGLVWTPKEDQMTRAIEQTLARRRSSGFPILLAHHPHAFDPAAAAGLPLTLSGHTHGGQLMLTKNLGAGTLIYRYWSGLYEKANASLVVSNGVGNWFPLRINAPAEIVQITLRAGQ